VTCRYHANIGDDPEEVPTMEVGMEDEGSIIEAGQGVEIKAAQPKSNATPNPKPLELDQDLKILLEDLGYTSGALAVVSQG